MLVQETRSDKPFYDWIKKELFEYVWIAMLYMNHQLDLFRS